MMQVGVDLRAAGLLPRGPTSVGNGVRVGVLAHHLAGLAEAVLSARLAEHRGTLAKDTSETVAKAIGDLRRSLTGLTILADPVARSAIGRHLHKQCSEARHDLNASDAEQRQMARNAYDRVQWCIDLLRLGECAIQPLVDAVTAELTSKITRAGDGGLKRGPGKLAERINADAVSVCARGFLDVLRSSGVFGSAIIDVLNGDRRAGGARDQVCDLVDAFWLCVTGREAADERGNTNLRDRFKKLLLSDGEDAGNTDRQIKALMAESPAKFQAKSTGIRSSERPSDRYPAGRN